MARIEEGAADASGAPRVLVVGTSKASALELHRGLSTHPSIDLLDTVVELDSTDDAVDVGDASVVVVFAERETSTLWRALMGIARPPNPLPVVVVSPDCLRTTAFLTGAEDWIELQDDGRADIRRTVTAVHNAVIRRLVAGGLPAHGHLHGLVTGIAHEVNNPLTVIIADLEDACERLGDICAELDDSVLEDELDDLHEMLREDQRAAQRIGALTHGLQNLARLADTVPSSLHTGPAIRRVLARLEDKNPTHPAPVVVGGTEWRVHASVHGFEEAVFHVVENAQFASVGVANAGPVVVEVESTDDHIIICVRDGGEGIRSDLEGRVLSPFVTGRPPGEGLGLGLTLAALAVRRAGGDVSIHARPEGGTEVRLVFLPARTPTELMLDDETDDLAAR